jgi:hypothetical protein
LWFLLFVGSDRLAVHDPSSDFTAIMFCGSISSSLPLFFPEFCKVGTVLIFIVFVR